MPFVIGVDFGTLSARAVLVDVSDGDTLGEGVWEYRKGVMTKALYDGTPLHGPDWALADPGDYWEALVQSVRLAVNNAGVEARQVTALAIAATACTLMPVDKQLVPLCENPLFKGRPHAYAKLWKHHRAQAWAERMTDVACRRKLDLLDRYGGKISSEWAVPKVLEVLYEDEMVYRYADRFMQFSDWLTARLTGDPDIVNGNIAAYKAMWDPLHGIPADDYLMDVDPKAPEIMHVKLRGRMVMAGERAGHLTKEGADMLGLAEGICVGMAHTDAHSSAYGVGAACEGDYVYILGTSTCGHLLSGSRVYVPGVTGRIDGGLLRGLACYSAGQACAGDMLGWMISHAVSENTLREAREKGVDVHQLLEEKAALKKPGQCGLLALDWWNGNRSPLVNADLSGLILGLTMDSRCEDIYRAMLDSIAFGHRAILDNFLDKGLSIKRVIICGGIAHKNRLLMQIMADVLGRPIEISSQTQASALGAAMCAAAASGDYACLSDAIRGMRSKPGELVQPVLENIEPYRKLYAIYHRLYHYFGQEMPQIMRQLRHGDEHVEGYSAQALVPR